MNDAHPTFAAAQVPTTALLNGAEHADVVLDRDCYGNWAALIENLAALYSDGGTPAVVRGFHVLARADRNIAALIVPPPACGCPADCRDCPHRGRNRAPLA